VVWINRLTARGGKVSPQTGTFIEILVSILRFISYQILLRKEILQKAVALKKQPSTDDGTTFKGKSIAITGGIFSPSDLNLSPIVKETVFTPSQGEAGDIHLPSTYETQLF